MSMQENNIVKLTSEDDKYACAIADKIISENQETDEWYKYKQDRAVTIGILKPTVTKMVLTDFPFLKSMILIRIAHQIIKSTTRIDPVRQFRRMRKHLSMKHSQNSRRVL